MHLSLKTSVLFVSLVALASSTAWGAKPVDFESDVLPILKNRCFACHGDASFEGGLRLDVRQSAFAGGDEGPAIIPGKPGDSLLLTRVESADAKLRMPKDDEPLPASEIATLKAWITEGAQWPKELTATDKRLQHWSFQAPKVSPLPNTAWPHLARGTLDRWIQKGLQDAQLSPSEEADRYTLARRVAIDLIGIPLSIEEVDQFVADTSPDAFERLVDRLMAAPAYGERWVRKWLDLARYSDTNGYEKDRPRSMWPYRDWVIQALNEDKPFDQFTIEQLAGDLLPGSTIEQKVATGFHRNTMVNEEGGVDNAEFRFNSVVDRVGTTSSIWLGLTMACAQCHSHKYDPLQQEEFYKVLACLDNCDEPEITLPNQNLVAQRTGIQSEIADLEAALLAKAEQLPAEFQAWQDQTRSKAKHWQVLRPTEFKSIKGASLDLLPDGSILVSGDIPNYDTYDVDFLTIPPGTTALRLEVLPHASLPDGGPGRAQFDSVGPKGDFLLSEFVVKVQPIAGQTPSEATTIPLGAATHDFAADGRSAQATTDGTLDTGWSIRGGIGKPHAAVYELKVPLTTGKDSKVTITLIQQYIHQMTIGRFRISATSDPVPVASSGVPAEIETLLLRPANELSQTERVQLLTQFSQVAPALEEARKAIAQKRATLPPLPTSLIMEERPPQHVRTTHRHHRGEFLSPRNVVRPGAPAALHPFSTQDSKEPARLKLARWLVAPENPLMARVTVNRAWQIFFGRGIVRTTEDFGLRGAPPTHPELLDYLAVDFVARGYSQKELHRRIVTSHSYRQSAAISPEMQTIDPTNQWLAHAPRFRLEAEQVRDVPLSAAGLLVERLGGPSVFSPQPEGAAKLSYGGLAWNTETGGNRYRRGLYTFSKRTSPYSMFTTFDGPTGETCLIQRERSNTPLQSLTILNDVVFVETAQALAARVLTELPEATPSASAPLESLRIEQMFRLATGRPCTTEELATLTNYLRRQQERLSKKELSASTLLGANVTNLPGSTLEERAAFTLLARTLLSLDESLCRP